MSVTVDLPNNNEAVLKDAAELTNREMKTIQRTIRSAASAAAKMRQHGYSEDKPESWATSLAELTDTEMNEIDLFQRTCVMLRLESWTLDRELPATEDEVDDLPRSIFDPLTIAAADIAINEEFGLAGAADPKAGTGNSSASKRRTKVASS